MKIFNKFVSCFIIASFIFSSEGFAVKPHNNEERKSLRKQTKRPRHVRKYRIKTTRMDNGLRNDLKTLGVKKRKYSLKPRELNNFMFGLEVVENMVVAAPQQFRETHPVLTESKRRKLSKMEKRARAAQGITPRVRNFLKNNHRFQG